MIPVPPPPSSAAQVYWEEFYRIAAISELIAAVDPERAGPRPTAFAAVYQEQIEFRTLHEFLQACAIIASAEQALPGIVERVQALADRIAAEDAEAQDVADVAPERVVQLPSEPVAAATDDPPPLTPEIEEAFRKLAARRGDARKRYLALMLDFLDGGDRFLRLDEEAEREEAARRNHRPKNRLTKGGA
ncbi:hypothetical protein [Limnoglobus roseus]|uniref:Uncharacterized protein n=1 Tax=Limnoglobus roseus TaxID=2598579 RepID=A0A5C1ALX1_9BACT|nr:hypothetical protein [Limnoglobus roseus]QEL20409.1 hypothetical protein PX52LOC_07503 [Limnoglobus roseus]